MSDPIPPEDHDENAGVDETQGAGPHASPKEMSQHPPLGADDDHSGSDLASPKNHDWTGKTDEDPNETLHTSPRVTSQDPSPHRDRSYSESRTDPQDTLISGNTSGVDVGDEGSGELSAGKLVFGVAEIGAGSDLNSGPDDSDEEDSLPETQRDDSEASGTLLVSTLLTRILDGRRFNSECR